MMMMTTRWIPEYRAVEGDALAMAMARTTAQVRRTCRVVRKVPGKGSEHSVERGNGS
jgi:hypothetical protein